MKFSKLSVLLLITVSLCNSLHPMDPRKSPESWQDLEICIASLLRLPGETTKDDMFNIIRTKGLNVALMGDYEQISSCVRGIKRSFMYQNIAQLSQQPMLTQCIIDCLGAAYHFTYYDSMTGKVNAILRPHAQAIIQQLRCAEYKRPACSETPGTSSEEEPKAKKQQTAAEKDTHETTSATSAVVSFWQQPWLISHMAEFLSLKDRFQLACASKDTRLSLQQSNKLEHFRTFMREVANPIDYTIHKAQGNPNVSIDGITYNTQEVLNFLYANIAEVLINNVYDPIVYVLEQAQGSSTVAIYGKNFDTNQLIKELYKLGADVNRVCDRAADNTYCEDIIEYSPSDDVYLPHHLEKIDIASEIYDTLTSEQKLDIAQWHTLTYDLPFFDDFMVHPKNHREDMSEFYNTIIDKCTELKCQYPNDGIVVTINGHIILTQEFIQKLSEFNIVSLMIPHESHFPGGIGQIEQLEHLRELFLRVNENAITDDSVKALCNLRQLRSLTIRQYNSYQRDSCITIPSEIINLKKLRFLDLREVWVQQLPQEIGQIEQLRLLTLNEDDPLNTLTPALASLKNLLILKIGWAQTDENITIAKNLMRSFKKLQKLYTFSCREITDLGDEIKHLSTVRLLGIYGPTVQTVIPDTICLFPALEELCVFIQDSFCSCTFSLLQYCADNHVRFWLDGGNIVDKTDVEMQDILRLRQRLESDKALSIISPETRSLADITYENALSTLIQPKEKPLLIIEEIIPLYRHNINLRSLLDSVAEQNTQELKRIADLRDFLNTHKEVYTQILRDDLNDPSKSEKIHTMANTLLELLQTSTTSEEQLWIAHTGLLPLLEQYIQNIQEKEAFVYSALH